MIIGAALSQGKGRYNTSQMDPRQSMSPMGANGAVSRVGNMERFTTFLNETPTMPAAFLKVDEQPAQRDFKILGNTMRETYQMYTLWLNRMFRFFLFYFVGTAVLTRLEGWRYLDCCYFISQTLSTIGYGDLPLTSTSSRMFVAFYIFVGILMVFTITADIAHSLVNMMKRRYARPQKLNKLQIIVRSVLNCMMWVMAVAFVNLAGGAVIAAAEGWSFAEGFFFAAVTTSTVGYGTKPLKYDGTKVFNVFFMLIAVPLTALALQKIAALKRHLDELECEQRLNNVELCGELLTVISKGEKDRVSRAEYILHMLQLAGRIDAERDILPWSLRFDDFDLDKDGYLTNEDVGMFKAKQRKHNAAEAQQQDAHGDGDQEPAPEAAIEPIDAEEGRANTFSSKPPAKRRSLFMQVADEMKAVFEETFKLTEQDSSNNGTDRQLSVSSTSSSSAVDQILSLQAAISSQGSSKGREVVRNVIHEDRSPGIEMLRKDTVPFGKQRQQQPNSLTHPPYREQSKRAATGGGILQSIDEGKESRQSDAPPPP